ncbi:hypothetical protein FQA39_LY16237 [Lamprigera yunnana]|nr:hypothetical protein FQA39_LY16237 [Lamprigera yunnana]
MSRSIRDIKADNEIDDLLLKHWLSPVRHGFVEVGEDNHCVPVNYKQYEEKLDKFEVRESDIYLIAHPKTGSTWAQELLWLISHNFDYEGAKENVVERFPNIELAVHIERDKPFKQIDYMTFLENLPNPRCLRSHLHWSLLPEQIRDGTKKPKIFGIIRRPEDVCISYYHYVKLMDGYKGSFEDFCRLFLAGRTCYGPFWKTVLSVWNQRHLPNVFILKYSEMKKDLKAVIREVAKFLERDVNEEAVEELAKHLHFDSMKENPAVNFSKYIGGFAKKYNLTTADTAFIRRGIDGGYKMEMTQEQIESFKKWTQENIQGTGLEIE